MYHKVFREGALPCKELVQIHTEREFSRKPFNRIIQTVINLYENKNIYIESWKDIRPSLPQASGVCPDRKYSKIQSVSLFMLTGISMVVKCESFFNEITHNKDINGEKLCHTVTKKAWRKSHTCITWWLTALCM